MGMARGGDRGHPCRFRQRRRHCRRPKRCHRFLGGDRPKCRHAADRHRRLSLVWVDLGRGGHRPDQPAAIQPDRRGDWARAGRGGPLCGRGWGSAGDSDHLPAIAWSVDCSRPDSRPGVPAPADRDRKSTRLNSSHVEISYAVFCLKKKKKKKNTYFTKKKKKKDKSTS